MIFLKYDSRFMVGLRRLVDYAFLGLLWILASVPVITFGAATTAALLTAEITIQKDEGKMLTTFWEWFRKEFKEATILWLIQLPLLGIAAMNVWLVYNSQLSAVPRALIYVASGVIFCWIQLWFGYLSKFEDTVKTILGNTLRITLANLGSALLLGVLALAALTGTAALTLIMPPLAILVPGAYLLSCTAVFRKVFAPFLPKSEPEASGV